MTTATLLQRTPITLPPVNSSPFNELDDCEELAVEAEKRLGYNALLWHLKNNRETAQKTEQGKELKEALIKLQIEPFSESTVAIYKEKMARQIAPGAVVLERLDNAVIICFLFGLLISMVSLVTGAAFSIFWTPQNWMWYTFAVSLLITMISFIASYLTGNKAVFGEWVKVPLHQYKLLVPEFALQTALDIKKEYSDVKLYVEELRLEKVKLDPFLVAEDPEGNQYYLEVWNEPGFKQKREC